MARVRYIDEDSGRELTEESFRHADYTDVSRITDPPDVRRMLKIRDRAPRQGRPVMTRVDGSYVQDWD